MLATSIGRHEYWCGVYMLQLDDGAIENELLCQLSLKANGLNKVGSGRCEAIFADSYINMSKQAIPLRMHPPWMCAKP